MLIKHFKWQVKVSKSLYWPWQNDKILNHRIHMENRVTDTLKNLRDKKEISIEQYEDLSPLGSRPGIIYSFS